MNYFRLYKKELTDSIYMIFLQGLNYTAPLIVFPYLMVVLGAEKFGYIGFSVSIVQYFMLIVDFGFNLTATKRIALNRNNGNELSRIVISTTISKIFLLLISLFALFLIAYTIPRFHVYQTTINVLSIMLIANTFSFIWFFQGIEKIKVLSIINIISKLTIFPLTFIFVKTGDDYLKAAAILSLVYLFGAIISVAWIFKNNFIQFIKVSINDILTELKDSFPIFLSQSAISIYTSLFVVILGYYSTAEEVGRYSAVERIVRGLCFLFYIPVSQVVFPRISILSKENYAESHKLFKFVLFSFIITMSFIGIVILIFSNYIVTFLGEDYASSNHLFKILAFLPLFVSLGAVYGQVGIIAMKGNEYKKYFQRTYIWAGILSISLAFILIPLYSSTGGAIALIITELFVFCCMAYFSKKS